MLLVRKIDKKFRSVCCEKYYKDMIFMRDKTRNKTGLHNLYFRSSMKYLYDGHEDN